MPHYTDTVVLITGASAGIGRAAALAFAREGARVALVARTEERLRPVADEVEEIGGNALIVPADVADRDQVFSMVETVIEVFGRIDILLNNAGIGLLVSVENMHPADLKRVVDVNVYGLIWCTQAVLPHMVPRKSGQIINVSSIVGKRAMPYMSGYCLSKFGVQAFSDSLRIEVAPHNIDVIVICPTRTATEFGDTDMMKKGGRRLDLHGMTAESVAGIIIRASRRRKREVVISLGSQVLNLANSLVPRVVDWAIKIAWGRFAKPFK